tara:strand:+ start:1208 stop:1792 length:585 start_codon:yes stop_codon:yes gene_type:complete
MRLYNKNYNDVLKSIENNTIDLLFCNFNNSKTNEVWIEFKRVLKKNGVIILLDENKNNTNGGGGVSPHNEIIELKKEWYKYKLKYENIFFKRNINIYIFKTETTLGLEHNEKLEDNCVIRSNTTDYDNDKPYDLLEYLLDLYTKPKNTILDLQMELGASARISFFNNRDFIGCEIDKTKYEIILSRFRTIKTTF